MDLSAYLVPAAIAIAGYGALLWRVSALEKTVAKAESAAAEAKTKAEAVDEKIETVRKDQGHRLGALESSIDRLEGFQAGYERGLRRSTKSRTFPIVPEKP